MTEDRKSLNELQVGQSGVIIKLNTKGKSRRRFLDMGLVPGESIKVERAAPLGDPIEFIVKGYHLSLRKKEASQILVEVK
jgi:Fe2+ transport system protein FeoA